MTEESPDQPEAPARPGDDVTCCDCACEHQHPDTGVIPRDSCVLCKWCSCRDHQEPARPGDEARTAARAGRTEYLSTAPPSAPWESREAVDLAQLPHETWCDLVAHRDCCPSRAESGCSCLTAEVVAAVMSMVGACCNSPPRLGRPLADVPSCVLPYGHKGFHRDDRRSEWGQTWTEPPAEAIERAALGLWSHDIAFCAFRYALGRQTYAVGEVGAYLIRVRDHLPRHARRLICSEIEEAIERGEAGADMDVSNWRAVAAALAETDEEARDGL